MVKVQLLIASWCPVCPAAMKIWRTVAAEKTIDYKEVDISTEEGKELVLKYEIKGVPVTIIEDQLTFARVPDPDEARMAIRQV